jgi:transglutaminase-like putative cysteine protease
MASEGHEERRGVCRDFAHLAVTLSRCMNIPARYCTGYLGDIGVPAPMDFSAWYEVCLDGTRPASTPGKRDGLPRSAQAATAALDRWFTFQFQGSRSATLLAG